jgi:hypothetical protein
MRLDTDSALRIPHFFEVTTKPPHPNPPLVREGTITG